MNNLEYNENLADYNVTDRMSELNQLKIERSINFSIINKQLKLININLNNKYFYPFYFNRNINDEKKNKFLESLKQKRTNIIKKRNNYVECNMILGKDSFVGGLKSKKIYNYTLIEKKNLSINIEFNKILYVYKQIYLNLLNNGMVVDILDFEEGYKNSDPNNTLLKILQEKYKSYNFNSNVIVDLYLLDYYGVECSNNSIINSIYFLRTFPIFHFIMKQDNILSLYTDKNLNYIMSNHIDFNWGNIDVSKAQFFNKLCFQNYMYTICNISNLYENNIDITKYYISLDDFDYTDVKTHIFYFLQKYDNSQYKMKLFELYNIRINREILEIKYHNSPLGEKENRILVILTYIVNYNIKFDNKKLTNEDINVLYTNAVLDFYVYYYQIYETYNRENVLEMYNNEPIVDEKSIYFNQILGDYVITTLNIEENLIEPFINTLLLFNYFRSLNDFDIILYLSFSSERIKIISNYNPIKNNLLALFDRIHNTEDVKIVVNM